MTELREEPWKALSPISVTDGGMVIEVREEHPSKAESPIVLTEDGVVKVTPVSEGQPRNKREGMVVIEGGMVMDCWMPL